MTRCRSTRRTRRSSHLAVGSHADIVVSYNVVDGNGGVIAQTATITITGTNDAPRFDGGC